MKADKFVIMMVFSHTLTNKYQTEICKYNICKIILFLCGLSFFSFDTNYATI